MKIDDNLSHLSLFAVPKTMKKKHQQSMVRKQNRKKNQRRKYVKRKEEMNSKAMPNNVL